MPGSWLLELGSLEHEHNTILYSGDAQAAVTARPPAVAHSQSSDPVAQKVYCKSILSLAELPITLELARGTNIPRKKIPNKGPPQIPKILYAN